MKRIATLLIATAMFAAASYSSAAQVKKLSVSDVKLLTVNPVSLTAADGTIEITIANKGKELKLTDIAGNIFMSSQEVCSCTADKFTVKRGTQTYTLKVKGTLSNPVALMNLIKTRSIDPGSLTADICFSIPKKKKGGKAYSFKAVALSGLVK